MIDQVPVYTVAVNSGFVYWAVQCDLCDDIVSDSTTDENLVDKWETEHMIFHDLNTPHVVHNIYPEGIDPNPEMMDPNIGGSLRNRNDTIKS